MGICERGAVYVSGSYLPEQACASGKKERDVKDRYVSDVFTAPPLMWSRLDFFYAFLETKRIGGGGGLKKKGAVSLRAAAVCGGKRRRAQPPAASKFGIP